MPYILPDVAYIILQHLFMSDLQAFLGCMRTCKTWHSLATPILWRDICLDVERLKDDCCQKLGEMLQDGHSSLKYVQSLTLCYRGTNKQNEAVTLLSRFQECSDQFYHLTSLSLSVRTMQSLHDYNMQLLQSGSKKSLRMDPQAAVYTQILEHLPPTVRNLELVDFHAEYHMNSTCMAIAKVLPQLRTLRLEDCEICTSAWDVQESCPLLEEVIITNYPSEIFPSCLSPEATWMSRTYDRTAAIMEQFVQTAHDTMRQYMPSITRFDIHTEGTMRGSDWSQLGDDIKDVFQCAAKLDLVNQKTTVHPQQSILGIEPADPHVIATFPRRPWLRLNDPASGDVVDLICQSYSAELLAIEQPLSWVSSMMRGGARLPRSLAKTRDHTYQWQETDYEEMKREAQRWYEFHGMRLKFWEDRVGRPLLHVQILEGLVVNPGVLKREITQEEREMDPDSFDGKRFAAIHSDW